MPAYIHSNHGASLISLELKKFLTAHGIASSHSSAYNFRGNGQVGKCNGIIWKTVSLALKTYMLNIGKQLFLKDYIQSDLFYVQLLIQLHMSSCLKL